eukprot:SAG31_NODE_48598_length_179_cov_171.700000_1_plen_53_part_10
MRQITWAGIGFLYQVLIPYTVPPVGKVAYGTAYLIDRQVCNLYRRYRYSIYMN